MFHRSTRLPTRSAGAVCFLQLRRFRAPPFYLLQAVLAAVLWCAAPAADAGILGREDIARAFPDALRVGDKDPKVPVWPIVKQDGPTETVVAYVFESVDLAPVPGFAGTPFDLLIALDRHGEFLEVRVLSQHEPVFVDGLGPEPLFRFVEQYRGKSLMQRFRIGSSIDRSGASGNDVRLDGISKATASVRIVNETVLAAALQVARAKLGYAGAPGGREPARVREDVFAPMTWAQLAERGLVRHLRVSRADVDGAFAGSDTDDDAALSSLAPADTASELWVACVDIPDIGRNLLGEEGYKALRTRLEPGDHALLVLGAGPWSFVGDDFVRGGTPDRLALQQDALPLGLRDLDMDLPLAAAGLPPGIDSVKMFRVAADTGFDAARPWRLALRVTRSKGVLMPEHISRDFGVTTELPAELFVAAASESPWLATWRERAPDLAILAGALALLTAVLLRPRRVIASPRRLAAFRWLFLAFTLGFVGWRAQAQLSVVSLLGLVHGLAGGDLAFFLYDPPTLLVGAFTLATLVVWGRGTFCGWLCPFGALQEFVTFAARRLGLPRWRPDDAVDRRLGRIKYALLAVLVATSFASPMLADRLVEAEPFKTAITLMFARSWPAVAYALLLLAAGAFAYKAFCRWLCPLGAGLALLGRLRRRDWLARRSECGRPCQLCRRRCEYGAIAADGRIRYDECFQCLDCVAIHDDPRRCVPLVIHARSGRRLGQARITA